MISNQSARIRTDVQKVVDQVPTIGEISGGISTLLKELEGVKSANVGLRSDLATLLEKVAIMSEASTVQPPAYSIHEKDMSPVTTESMLKDNLAALNLALEKLTVR